MLNTEIIEKICLLTGENNAEKALEFIVVDYLSLKIEQLQNKISFFESKWKMNYEEFEKKSVEMSDGFSYTTEKEYLEWGETVAALKYYSKIKEQWT